MPHRALFDFNETLKINLLYGFIENGWINHVLKLMSLLWIHFWCVKYSSHSDQAALSRKSWKLPTSVNQSQDICNFLSIFVMNLYYTYPQTLTIQWAPLGLFSWPGKFFLLWKNLIYIYLIYILIIILIILKS